MPAWPFGHSQPSSHGNAFLNGRLCVAVEGRGLLPGEELEGPVLWALLAHEVDGPFEHREPTPGGPTHFSYFVTDNPVKQLGEVLPVLDAARRDYERRGGVPLSEVKRMFAEDTTAVAP